MALSRSKQEYLDASGWSSKLFLDHAKLAFEELNDIAEFDVGRTVIHICDECDVMVKAYVHRNCRTKEFMTLTDKLGNELKTFHCSDDPRVVVDYIKGYLEEHKRAID